MLPNPPTFAHWTDVTLRFSDQDALGHVNNTKYPQFFEAGRVAFIRQMMSRFQIPYRSILASTKINYVQQLHYPGTVRVGTRLIRLGNSSYDLEQVVHRDDAPEQKIATCVSTMVFFDYQANRKVPASEELRRAFDQGEAIP